MRISTAQIYQLGLNAMQQRQAELQQTELQISSGLKIMKPSDDPSGAVKVLNVKGNMAVIDQYSRNAAVAESALAFEESVLDQVNTALQRIRELTVQGNNSTNLGAAKTSIGKEIEQRFDELLALANTRDAAGEYIFAGFKVDSPPFIDDGSNVSYQGDLGQRMLQVGEGSQVAMRDSGRAIFQEIPAGDGNVQIDVNPANTGSAVIGQFGLTGNFVPDTYTVTFTRPTLSDPITYTVTDTAANVVSTGTYVEGSNLSFAGVQFRVDGVPANGDSLTVAPAQNRDIFTTVRSIADALFAPTPSNREKAGFHNAMGMSLAHLDQALENINNARAGIGARLNNVQSIDEINQDFKLQLETVLSDTQDLDYAEAISRFNLQLTALQAAQQAYIKTSGLTLFQYL